jgi:hypothetical protein
MSSERATRVRSAPARLHEEQAAEVEWATLLSQFRNPTSTEVESEPSDDESGPEEEEERKESDRRPPPIAWSKEHQPIQQRAFTPSRHPSHPHPHADTPIDFLLLFLTDEFLEACVTFTNEYAEKQRAEAAPRTRAAAASSNSHEWDKATVEEIKAMFGCLIYMGVVQLNDTRDYWRQLTVQPFITSTFPRDRFLDLLSNLRVSDDEEDEDDPLIKIRSLIDVLTHSFQHEFYPSQEVCIDEVMIGFKGRSKMRQHIAKKKSPTGFKVWTLVDIPTNYVFHFDIYTGKQEGKSEEGMTKRLVMKLMSCLEAHSWHRVGMDGFFTSVELFRELESKGFLAVGTIRHNRKHFPKELLEEMKGFRRGEWVWRQYKNLVCTSYMDKKPVNLLSTFCDPVERETIQRRTGSELNELPCPAVLTAYLRTMRGADVFAQRLSYSKIGRKSKKWFYSLIWFLIDTTIHNAFILYQKKHNKHNYAEKDFRKEVMSALVSNFTARKVKSPQISTKKRSLESLHTITYTKHRGTCGVCRNRVGQGGHNRRSHYRCEECNIFVCIPDCYNKHTQELWEERMHCQ